MKVINIRLTVFTILFVIVNSISFQAKSEVFTSTGASNFQENSDTTRPVITHIPISSCVKKNWPATVNANVTDNTGVDSVWVSWRKNSGAYKRFNLLHSSGNSWTGKFNSDTNEVVVSDIIYYRIHARDNSAMQNTDSTLLFNFPIIQQYYAEMGTDTIQIGWPFYTFYMDSRTQMLYLSNEIYGSGYMTTLKFNVVSASSQLMNNFMIKMKHTSDTSISSFVSTGMTTVFDGSFTVPGPGWQHFNLQTPFYYAHPNNLLIEICFNNSTYTNNTIIFGSPANGKNIHNHADLSSGDGCTGITSPGLSYTTRPNIQIYYAIPILIKSEEEIPKKYSLSQNYPNPFNPVTKINFSIPKYSFVSLIIYDILGREIKSPVKEYVEQGNYSIDFNASEFSSGVYFYKLTAGDFSETKRMILLK